MCIRDSALGAWTDVWAFRVAPGRDRTRPSDAESDLDEVRVSHALDHLDVVAPRRRHGLAQPLDQCRRFAFCPLDDYALLTACHELLDYLLVEVRPLAERNRFRYQRESFCSSHVLALLLDE